MEGLAALVRERMRADPFSGAVYVFRAKLADRIKMVFWNGTDTCLFDQTARGWDLPLAEDQGRRNASVGRAIVGAARGLLLMPYVSC